MKCQHVIYIIKFPWIIRTRKDGKCYLLRMAQTYDTFWQQRYAKRLEEIISGRTDVLISGNAQDYADYKHNAGIIQGIRMAIDVIDEINTEIKKAEQGRT